MNVVYKVQYSIINNEKLEVIRYYNNSVERLVLDYSHMDSLIKMATKLRDMNKPKEIVPAGFVKIRDGLWHDIATGTVLHTTDEAVAFVNQLKEPEEWLSDEQIKDHLVANRVDHLAEGLGYCRNRTDSAPLDPSFFVVPVKPKKKLFSKLLK